ncbi:MAG: YqaJ viral recombinase family protein [Anaerovoracaceae bacterium]|jgi:putative phage-type endonuclease
MAKKLINVADLSRDDWLDWRKKGIGGSDAGAILGMNPWRSAIDVWADKTGKSAAGEKEETEAMRLGRDLETYVAKRWEEATGKKVRRNNYMLQHDKYPFMIADLDREIIGEKAILECKTASPFTADKWEDDNVPASYTIQCLHYMAVTEAERCYLACLIFGRGVEFRTIERNEEAIDALIQKEKQFWNDYIVTNIMPPPDGSEAADDALKEMYKNSDPDADAVELSGDIKRYDEINGLIASLETEKKEMEQAFKEELKEAEIGYCGPRKVTWKTQKGRERLDKKRLKEEHPDIYNEYVTYGESYRVFRVSKPEKKGKEN